jgi:hypothetical protein
VKKALIIAAIIGLLALFLRGFLAFAGPIEYDEPVYVEAARAYAGAFQSGDLAKITSLDQNSENPIFNKLLYGLVLSWFEDGSQSAGMHHDILISEMPAYNKLLALRMLSVLSGSAAVFILSLANPLAGLLLAIHTFAIKYTSVIYIEAVPLLMSVLAVWAFSRFLGDNPAPAQSQNGRQSWGWLLISAAAMGLAMASKYIYAATGLAIVIYVLFRMAIRRKWFIPQLLLWVFLSLGFFVLADPYLWREPFTRLSATLQSAVYFSQEDKVFGTKIYPFWQPLYWLALSIPNHSLATEPFYERPSNFFILADTIILLLALAGIPRLLKREPLYFTWLALGLFILLIWNTKWPQGVLLILAPFCMAAAQGLVSIFDIGQKIQERIWQG